MSVSSENLAKLAFGILVHSAVFGFLIVWRPLEIRSSDFEPGRSMLHTPKDTSPKIPKIVHFIFGLSKPRNVSEPAMLLYYHYLAIKSAALVIKPDRLMLHYHRYISGHWFEKAKRYITEMRRIDPLPEEVFGRKLEHYAHKADYLRVQVLRQFGGMYFDMDFIALNGLDAFLENDCVMAQEGKGENRISFFDFVSIQEYF